MSVLIKRSRKYPKAVKNAYCMLVEGGALCEVL